MKLKYMKLGGVVREGADREGYPHTTKIYCMKFKFIKISVKKHKRWGEEQCELPVLAHTGCGEELRKADPLKRLSSHRDACGTPPRNPHQLCSVCSAYRENFREFKESSKAIFCTVQCNRAFKRDFCRLKSKETCISEPVILCCWQFQIVKVTYSVMTPLTRSLHVHHSINIHSQTIHLLSEGMGLPSGKSPVLSWGGTQC